MSKPSEFYNLIWEKWINDNYVGYLEVDFIEVSFPDDDTEVVPVVRIGEADFDRHLCELGQADDT